MPYTNLQTNVHAQKCNFFLFFFGQESVGTKSAPVGETPSTPRKSSNGLASPAKSVERSQSTEEQKTAKAKPPALNNITSEATSTMSPPPAKKLALSAKKVNDISHPQQQHHFLS